MYCYKIKMIMIDSCGTVQPTFRLPPKHIKIIVEELFYLFSIKIQDVFLNSTYIIKSMQTE